MSASPGRLGKTQIARPHPKASSSAGLRWGSRICMLTSSQVLLVMLIWGPRWRQAHTGGPPATNGGSQVEKVSGTTSNLLNVVKGVPGPHVQSASFAALRFLAYEVREIWTLPFRAFCAPMDARLQNGVHVLWVTTETALVTGEAASLSIDCLVVGCSSPRARWVVWWSLTYVSYLFFLLDVTLFGKGCKHLTFPQYFLTDEKSCSLHQINYLPKSGGPV